MSKYENGKIYKIVSKNTDKCYVGSTCQKLKDRLCSHITDFKRNSCVTSKHIIKFGDYEIILIENHSCENEAELTNRERFYIESMNCVNKTIPGRSKKEWYQDNREVLIEAAKQYRQKFKEKYTCECGGKFIYLNREQHKKTKKHIKFINNIEF